MLEDRMFVKDTINKLHPDVSITEKGNICLTVLVNDTAVTADSYTFEIAAIVLKSRYEKHVADWAKHAGMTQKEGIS